MLRTARPRTSNHHPVAWTNTSRGDALYVSIEHVLGHGIGVVIGPDTEHRCEHVIRVRGARDDVQPERRRLIASGRATERAEEAAHTRAVVFAAGVTSDAAAHTVAGLRQATTISKTHGHARLACAPRAFAELAAAAHVTCGVGARSATWSESGPERPAGAFRLVHARTVADPAERSHGAGSRTFRANSAGTRRRHTVSG